MKILPNPGHRTVWTVSIMLVGLAVVTVVTAVALQRMESTLTRDALLESQEWLDAVVDGRAGALETWLGSGLQMVRSVADYPGVVRLASSREGRHRVQAHLDTMVRSFGVHSAAVIGVDGTELVASSRESDIRPGELRPLERAPLTATPPVVLERHLSDGVAVTFRLPIQDTLSGSQQGLAVLRHYPSQRLLAELAAPAGTTQPVTLRLLIRAEDGVVYALTAEGRVAPAPYWLSGVIPDFGEWRPDAETSAVDEREPAPGEGILTSSRPVQGADWWLVGVIDRQPILIRVERELKRSGTVVCLALLALVSATIGAWRHWRAAHYQALAGSQARFRAIFEGAPVPLFELDLSMAAALLKGESGQQRDVAGSATTRSEPAWPELTTLIRVTNANRAALKLLGAASIEELKDGYGALLAGDGYELLLNWWRSVVEGKAEFERETRLHPLHGGSREVSVRVRNPESGDSFDRVLVSILDLTESRALEAQLQQAQKMEAVGRLAGGVAHDFNNILQAMLVAAESLKLASGDREHVGETAAELGTLVRRAGALTRQLLLFSRRETTALEQLDLNQVVLGMTKMLRRLVRENIAFRVEPTQSSLPVKADHGQLEQVLLNLVVNAVDAMPEGGALVVRTARGDGELAVLEVEDTGHGIPPEVRDHLFEPFFTTKGAGEGTGLGLSVVHGIVTVHGGAITVDSTEGGGTTIRIVLPLAAGEPDSSGETIDEVDLPRGRGELVLIVEDNRTVRKSLVDILRSLGYEVAQAGSGEEVALMEGLLPHALLTDYLLPGMTGLQLAERCRTRWPDVCVILMSGYSADRQLDEAVKAGTVRFLRKPASPSDLARELRRLLDET